MVHHAYISFLMSFISAALMHPSNLSDGDDANSRVASLPKVMSVFHHVRTNLQTRHSTNEDEGGDLNLHRRDHDPSDPSFALSSNLSFQVVMRRLLVHLSEGQSMNLHIES